MEPTIRIDAPPAPSAAPQGVSLSVAVENALAHAGSRTRAHVLTRIAAGGGGGGPRLPVNIALAIDRSGSMEGEPLEYVKRACAHVVDLLSPDDVLSIVTFEETVEVLMPARRVTDPNLIKQHLARIVPGNTTNLFDGLYAAGAQAASVPLDGYVTRVLLLTDGEPTAGLKDFQSIVGQAQQLRERGIAVTALGFGPEYNEELLAGIARRSGGNYHFVQRPEQIPQVFREEIQAAQGVAARGLRLRLDLPRGVVVRQCYGSPPEFGPRSASIALPDLERGASLTKVWELEYEPRGAGIYRVAKATLSFDDGGAGRTVSGDAVVEFVLDPTVVASGADPDVARELSVIQASRDLEKTLMGMRTMRLSTGDAAAALERTRQMLAQDGRADAAEEVAEATRALRRGDTDSLDKTLIGTIYELDRGKRS